VHASAAALLIKDSPLVISFTVPGSPVPKERARSGGGHFYTPERTAAGEAAVLAAFLGVTRRYYDDRGAWGIVVTAYLPGLAGGDGDNIVKLAKDALSGKGRTSGAAWHDDKQVVSGIYATVLERDSPRTEITVYRIGDGSATVGDGKSRQDGDMPASPVAVLTPANRASMGIPAPSSPQEDAPGHDNGPPASGPATQIQGDLAGPASPSGSSTSQQRN